MMMTKTWIAALAVACATAVAPARSEPVATAVPAATPLGSGPYKAVMESPPGLATHTLYRPADLSAD